MATRLTVPGQIVKWIVVPGLLAAAGYYLIGPRVGKRADPPAATSAAPTGVPEPSSTSGATATTSDASPVPGGGRLRGATGVRFDSENYPQSPPGNSGETGSESSVAR